jgi:hypothetical protein
VSFLSLLIHDVTVSNPTSSGEDRYGNATETLTSVTEKMRVEPKEADEELIDRDTRLTRFRVFARPDSVVTGLSTLTWETRSLRVVGEPLPFYGRTTLHHYELTAEEIRG